MQISRHLMLDNFISYQRSKAKNKAKFCGRAECTNLRHTCFPRSGNRSIERPVLPTRPRLPKPWNSLIIPSVDKGRHGFDGQKCTHTASSPLAIRQVFPAGLFLSGHISAPAKLLRTCQRWIFQGFLVFETQAGACPPRRKGQKSPKRRGDRRVCPC